MIIEVNMLTSFVTSMFALLVLRGLLPFWNEKDITKDLCYLAKGLSWLTATVILRSFYWGFFYTIFVTYWPRAWSMWSSFVQGTSIVNPIFDIMTVIGLIYILRAYLEMIPQDQRHGWSLLKAPFYPNEKIKRITMRYLFGVKK